MLTELDLILEEKVKEKRKPAQIQKMGKMRFKKKTLRVFAQSLSRLLGGGVPLISALDVLENESNDKSFRSFLTRIKDRIRQGESFSQALSKQSLPSYFIQMLEAGELSGNVPEILKLLADHLFTQEERKRKILEAVIYPSLVLGLGIISFFILLQFVIPRITQVYQDFESELPWLTRMIISLSQLAIPFLLSSLFFFGFMVYGFRTQKDLMIRLFSELPFVSGLIKKSFLAQFSSLFSLLLKSGIPILKALDSVSSTFDSQALKEDFEEIKSKIAEGTGFTQALGHLSWMSESSRALIRSGEESGKLPEAFEAIQKEASIELESQIHFGLKVLEPLLIVIVGLAVGFIVVGAILPILEMSELVR